ncbi:hypothetical protein C8R46DRAFT_1318742 [Mycena filopes]|nr:hypothetical protein C8R46DRAFT_1318742 [Mycena filopes]
MATTTSSAADKNAEFAKLFDLFEMLANRRSRMAATGCAPDDTHAIAIPADLEPVFRSLATVVPPRGPASRGRRNTVAALGRTTLPDSDNDSLSDAESVAKFPLGKTYTFTFKMMIHKLYQVDEWAEKVRDVLKRSQIDYKPLALAEQEEVKVKKVQSVATAPVAEGRVHFKPEVTVGGKKSIPLAHGRLRSQSVAFPGRVSTSPRIPLPTPPALIQDDARAIKKRCTGRRKSVSGGPLSPATPVGEGWIYDAAVSSTEVCERVPFRVETTASFTPVTRPRQRYQSLQTGSRKMDFGPRRIVSAIATKEVTATASETAPRTSTKRRLSE